MSQNRPRTEHYRRLPGDAGQWILTVAEGMEAAMLLLEDDSGTNPCRVPLNEIYDRVTLPELCPELFLG